MGAGLGGFVATFEGARVAVMLVLVFGTVGGIVNVAETEGRAERLARAVAVEAALGPVMEHAEAVDAAVVVGVCGAGAALDAAAHGVRLAPTFAVP